jgi:hypothetical protein
MTEIICICDARDRVWQQNGKDFRPYTGECPKCGLLNTDAESKHVGERRASESRKPRKLPTLNREFKGKVGDIGVGFYEGANGSYSVGTGKIVKIERHGVFIEKPLSPRDIEMAKKE